MVSFENESSKTENRLKINDCNPYLLILYSYVILIYFFFTFMLVKAMRKMRVIFKLILMKGGD